MSPLRTALNRTSWLWCIGWVGIGIEIGILVPAFAEKAPSPAAGSNRVVSAAAPVDRSVPGESVASELDGVRRLFRDGQLEAMGPACVALMGSHSEDPELRALYAIYFMARGESAAARAQYRFLDASVAGPSPSFHVLCAVAMMSRTDGKAAEATRACQQAIAADPSHPYPWNTLGRIYYEAGDLSKALEAFQRAVSLNDRFAPAHWNLGAIAFQTADYTASLKAYRRAIELNPADCGSHYGVALVLEAEGQIEAALSQVDEMLQRCPDDSDALARAATLQARMGSAEKALLNGLRMQKIGLPGAVSVLADAYLQKGDLASAWSLLTNAPAQDAEISYLRGYAALAGRRLPEALESMETALKREPGHWGARFAITALTLRLGQPSPTEGTGSNPWPRAVAKLPAFLSAAVPAAKGDWAGALERLQAAEGVVPGFSTVGLDAPTLAATTGGDELAILNLGVLLHLKHLDLPALEYFQEALRARPDSPLANYWAGIAAGQLGRKVQAREFFDRASRRAPRFFAALYASGELHFAQGQPEKAVACFRAAREVQAEPGLSLRLGSYYEHVGRLDLAEAEYRALLKQTPEFFVANNQLAWLFAKQETHLDEALQLALRADELMPGNASVLDTLGWIHHLRKDTPKALEKLRQSAEINPRDPGVWYHLAVVQNAAGDRMSSRRSVENALALKTPFEDAAKARLLLEGMR